jgi:branched-chain amino acid transport system substrate-binding protein
MEIAAMRRSVFSMLWASLVVLGLASVDPALGESEVTIPVVLPLTGNAAFVGREQRQMLQLVEKSANASGGIRGRPVRFIYYDDETVPQVSVQLASEILAQHPSVLLGSSITAMCNAMAPLMKSGPVMYCLSPGIKPTPGGYVFSTYIQTQQLEGALVRYLRQSGLTRIGMLSSTDATGQDADEGMKHALVSPENSAIKMVAHPHFNASDVSVTAQIEAVKAAGAQTLIAWSTGGQIANVLRAILQVGLDIPVATTPGNQQFQQLAQYKSFLPKELLIPCAFYPPHQGVVTLDPATEKLQDDMYRLLAAAHLKPDNATGTAWDPALIVISALRSVGPDAKPEQIRDYINNLTDFPGINGLYNFKKVPQRGIEVSSAIVVRYEPTQERWQWVSSPGGVPLGEK